MNNPRLEIGAQILAVQLAKSATNAFDKDLIHAQCRNALRAADILIDMAKDPASPAAVTPAPEPAQEVVGEIVPVAPAEPEGSIMDELARKPAAT